MLFLREFASTIKRPFGVRYNPCTQSVQILSNTKKIIDFVIEPKGDLSTVTSGLQKIEWKMGKIKTTLFCKIH